MPTPVLFTSLPSSARTGRPDHLPHPASRTVTRPATIDDFDAVNALHERCSLETRFARYHAARGCLRLAEFQHLTRPDHSLTWITHPDDDPGRIIATVNLVRTTDPDTAELGIMIEDGWQSRGLGTSLARYARTRARTLGCTSMVAVTGSTNVRMLKIMRTLGALPWTITGTTVDVTVPVA